MFVKRRETNRLLVLPVDEVSALEGEEVEEGGEVAAFLDLGRKVNCLFKVILSAKPNCVPPGRPRMPSASRSWPCRLSWGRAWKRGKVTKHVGVREVFL